ncbi:MAG: SDR family NAD(P)-dependent oxidoreductase [Phototrophicaceae bacterium]|jgi:NAD(P)-dependent dehydrogenase (short-subunit alcohol dehydrogenase family)
MGLLENRPIAIVGGGRGMGAAMARLCAEEGAPVIVMDLPSGEGQTLVDQINAAGGRAIFIAADVSDEGQIASAFVHVQTEFSGLYGLCNVAGINHYALVTEMTLADWNRMMAVNVRGAVLTMKHALPLMQQFGSGAVVNMASVSGMIGSVGYAAYHTTKGAVMALTRSVAQEFAPYHIRVNAVAPGWVDTRFTTDALARTPDPEGLRAQAGKFHALGRMAQPEEVAAAAVFLLSDDASFITAETLFVDGGFMIKR